MTRSDWNNVGPPYTPLRYAEIDGVFANRRARNLLKDAESDTKTYFPSDHFPVNYRFKIKLAKNTAREEEKKTQ